MGIGMDLMMNQNSKTQAYDAICLFEWMNDDGGAERLELDDDVRSLRDYCIEAARHIGRVYADLLGEHGSDAVIDGINEKLGSYDYGYLPAMMDKYVQMNAVGVLTEGDEAVRAAMMKESKRLVLGIDAE